MDTDRSIRFHIEEDYLPADELKKCVSEFVDLIKDAASDCLSDITWLTSIEKGSVALAAFPVSATETDREIDACLETISEDLHRINNGLQPNTFSLKTIDRYSRLAKACTDKKGNPKSTITVESPAMPSIIPVDIKPYNPVDTENATDYSFGSAYGIVKSISAVNERYLALYDELTEKKIKVIYKKNMTDVVRESFENRVCVVGMIEHDSNGEKKSIVASDIRLAPREEEVRFIDLFGTLKEAANG